MTTDSTAPAPPSLLYSFRFLLLLTVVSGLLAELVAAGLRTTGLRDQLPALLSISLPAIVSGALFPYLVIRVLYASTLRDFGIRWTDPERRFWPWLLASSALVIAGWTVGWGLIVWAVEFNAGRGGEMALTLAEFHAMNPLFKLFHEEFDGRMLSYVIHMSVVVGFAEELFGRGLLQNALDRRHKRVLGWGRFTLRTSTLAAAVLFAFWHTEWLSLDLVEIVKSLAMSMTIVLVPSLVLAVVYERTRSMLAVILLHNVIDGGKLAIWYVWSLFWPG